MRDKLTLEEELKRIAKKHSGVLTPESVVATAVDPKNPLHNEFEWNNDAAAHQYRLYQARKLIQEVKMRITYNHQTILAPLYVRNPVAEQNEQGYVATTAVTQADQAQWLLEREVERIESALERAQGIAAVLGVSDELKRVAGDMLRRLSRIVRKARPVASPPQIQL